MTPVKHDTITIGNPIKRNYQDAFGRPLRKGDYIAHAIAQSSSVSLNVYKIDAIKDTDKPVNVGGDYDAASRVRTTVNSWDRAFSLRVIRCEYDSVKNRVKLPKVWRRTNDVTFDGKWTDIPEDEHKRNTIKAVQRVIRLDLDD